MPTLPVMTPAQVPQEIAVPNWRSNAISNVSLGHTGLLQPTPESVIFLGRIYHYDLLRQTRPVALPQTQELCTGLDEPDPERLLALLSIGEVALRPLYLHMHWRLMEQRDDAEAGLPTRLAGALAAEYHQYRRLDSAWLQTHVFKKLDQSDGHWRFKNFLHQHKRRPDVTWRGHVDVPVHRLLWPLFRPAEALRPENRLRKRDICPDELARDCVNPHHFEYAIPMTERRALYPGQQNTQRGQYTRYMHKWSMDDVWVDTFNGVTREWVHCPEHRHIMPSGVQSSLLLMQNPQSHRYTPHPAGRSKCARCYERFRQERGVLPNGKIKRRPEGIAAPNNLAREQQYNDIEKGMWDTALREGWKITSSQ